MIKKRTKGKMGQTINPSGKQIIKVETEFHGKKFSLEVGRVGFRSSGSVIARYGETVVLGTAMLSDKPVSGMDYFPLSIEYEERFYAAGRISGSRFVKREGRPSDEAILIGRIIDRPIRPLWPKGYRNEVQAIATVMSLDPTFRPDMVAMIAVSTALMMTGGPFDGPVAGLRIGLDENGKLSSFLSLEQLKEGGLDLIVAGTKEGIIMVEAGCKEVTEEKIVEGIEYAQKEMQPLIDLQNELIAKLDIKKQEYELSLPDKSILDEVAKLLDGKLGEDVRKAYPERNELIGKLRKETLAYYEEKLGEDFPALKTLTAKIKNKTRICKGKQMFFDPPPKKKKYCEIRILILSGIWCIPTVRSSLNFVICCSILSNMMQCVLREPKF